MLLLLLAPARRAQPTGKMMMQRYMMSDMMTVIQMVTSWTERTTQICLMMEALPQHEASCRKA